MDDVGHFLGLFLWCGLGAVLVLAVYYAKYWVKGFFRGFRKLRTEAILAKMTRESRSARFLSQRLTGLSRGERKVRKIHEFMKAAESGDLNEVRRLVNHGMDVNARRAMGGKTALMRASRNGSVSVVTFLLQKGADVNATGGQSGKTALIRASEAGHWEVVELLIEARADVNAASAVHGKTALMGAIEHGSLATALLLLHAGADVRARDKKGQTAEDIGTRKGRIDLLEVLRTKGAAFSRHTKNGEKHSHGLDHDECYAVLGCKKTDSHAQIKAQYHALMKQFHPDVIQAKDMPDAFVKFAGERCLRIQEAYHKIMNKS